MKGFRIAIVVFALLPIATGLADIVIGTSAWKGIGVGISEEGFKDSVLDSQIRFLATIWLGYGVLLCLCARGPTEVREHSPWRTHSRRRRWYCSTHLTLPSRHASIRGRFAVRRVRAGN